MNSAGDMSKKIDIRSPISMELYHVYDTIYIHFLNYIHMLLAMIFLQVVVQPWSLVAFDRARERLMCGRQVAESSLRYRRAVEKKCAASVGSSRQMGNGLTHNK